MDNLEEQLNNLENIYVKSKAEAEVKELSSIAQDTTKALQTKLNSKVAEHIDNSQQVAEKIEKTADILVEKGLKAQEHKVNADLKDSEKKENDAEFGLDEDNYRAFGQGTAPRKKWKKKMIEIGNDFWFIVIYIVCFFSLAPFYNFAKIIKTQSGVLKVVAIIIGVIMLLACLGGLTYACLKWSGLI